MCGRKALKPSLASDEADGLQKFAKRVHSGLCQGARRVTDDRKLSFPSLTRAADSIFIVIPIRNGAGQLTAVNGASSRASMPSRTLCLRG